MIAQKLLGQDLAAAAIAIDAAQIKGVLPLPLSALRATLPVFKNPTNKHKAVSLTAEQFRFAFGNAISAEESQELYDRWTIPAPGQAAVRGGRSELRPALAGQGRHGERVARPAAADHGRQGPHRPGGGHEGDAQAVPALRRGHRHQGVRRPGALADHRRRLARGRRHLPGLAAGTVPLSNTATRFLPPTGDTVFHLRKHAKSHRGRMLVAAVGVLASVALIVSPSLASADPATASHPQQPKPTIVLVHGAWADASTWSKVTTRLQHDGYTVLAAPNPLRGLASDAAYLSAFLQQHTTGPVILVGHSYGGAVITNAALSDPDVKALVYIDAFVPDQGDTILGLLGGGADPNALFDAVQYPGAPAGDVDLYIKTAIFPSAFAADLPAATAAQLAASQRPIALSALTEPSGPPAWKTLPSWYLLGTDDNILPPAVQLTMAQRAGSHITRVAASHLSMLSHPEAAEKIIIAAARATG